MEGGSNGDQVIVAALACTICGVTTTTASAQSKAAVQPASAESGRINSGSAPLQKAASEAGAHLAWVSATAPQPARREKSKAVAVGAAIGAAAGVTGGLLQPTHGNGEHVLGSSRETSALALGAVGAGIGALIGFVIDKAR